MVNLLQTSRDSGPQDLGTVEQIARCQTNYEVFLFAKSVARQFDYTFFSILTLPEERNGKSPDSLVVSNWPPELTGAYDQMSLLQDSSILEQLSRSTRPALWSLKSLEQAKDTSTAVELLAEFGIENGVYFSVHDASGRRGVVSFAGKRAEPSEIELMELSFDAGLLYDRLCVLNPIENDTRSALTGRERECLIWTAAGKTSGEIATILELSEHTVTHYLGIACQKLDAVNRVHAVSKAIRAGLLD